MQYTVKEISFWIRKKIQQVSVYICCTFSERSWKAAEHCFTSWAVYLPVEEFYF